MLSGIVLAKNEEKNIEKVIKSLNFCDEVIVINNDSSDNTEKLAINYGATVINKSGHDFSKLRNYAVKKAKGNWILFIDADERVTDNLKKEVKNVISKELNSESTERSHAKEVFNKALDDTNKFSSYKIKRRDFFFGRELKYGETLKARNQGIIRLFKKGAGSWQGNIHEEFISKGQTGTLDSFLDHYPHQTITDFLKSINYYSSIRAQELYDQGIKTNILEIISYPVGKFFYTYFVKAGILDGAAGYVYSFMMSFHSFLVRSKLYLLTHPSRTSL